MGLALNFYKKEGKYMAIELTATAIQTVAVNQNVLFTDVPIDSCNCNIIHREGSGIITLRGGCNQCRALYKVSFGANIGGGAAGPFSLAIAIDGEALASATGTVQAGGADEYNNVYVSVLIPVLRGTSVSISVENTSAAAVNVQNANIIVERVA